MTPLATLDQVKQHLRIDGPDADSDLTLKLAAASERVALHLNGVSPYLPVVQGAAAEVRPIVRAAVLLLVGYLYRYPSGDEKKAFDDGRLPAPITALLAPLRRKVLA
ncbi:head-tail connector protein [Paracidovorax oryzae]|uniref:head-tail connector protein n=1 Tax=Paracidovorax oryzae TaxID=862720 RepID=UPI0035D09237